MFKKDDFVVYKRYVCKITDIKKSSSGQEYYVLVPIDDDSLKIDILTDNQFGFIRKIISLKEAEEIINSISEIDIILPMNNKLYEREYIENLNTGKHENLIKIIKTSYLRNADRIKNNKKISEKDDIYFKKAEKLLYNELSIALNKTYDETKEYVINKVKEKIESV